MFLTQIVNGQVSELALCEHCAKEKGLFDPQSLTFAEKFFPTEFRAQIDKLVRELAEKEGNFAPAPRAEQPAGDMLTQCPVCGFPLETYRRTGRMGCPDCYTVFAQELDTAPAGDEPAEEENGDSLESLQRQLEAAVEREDYETAAQLRDRIKELGKA